MAKVHSSAPMRRIRHGWKTPADADKYEALRSSFSVKEGCK